MEPAHGHWSMTVLRRGLPTHCLLWRTTPPCAPLGRGSTIFQTSENFCSALEAFPSIPSAFQKEIHQKRHFIELSSDPAGFWQRLKILSCWKNRGGTSLKEVKFLCSFSFSRLHSSFSSFSFRCRRLLCLIPGMDRQAVVSGSLSRCKMMIHPFSPLFLLPVLIDYEFVIGAFFVAHKMNLLLHRGKPCYLGWQTRGQARKKWKINGPGLKQNSKRLCLLCHPSWPEIDFVLQ